MVQVGLGENGAEEEMLLTTAGGMMTRTAVSNIRCALQNSWNAAMRMACSLCMDGDLQRSDQGFM